MVEVADGVLAGVPLERFAAIALEAAARAGSERFFLDGYVNGLIGYLPGEEDLASGGYEVEWAPVAHGAATGWLTPFERGAGERLVAAVLEAGGR